MESDFEARAGLGDLAARLGARPCRIAYLGASVTAQRDGYRPRLHEWLVRRFGQPHEAINAGIGAVGAMTAVFAMDDFVLCHGPDLCLIECSTGDIESQSPLLQLGPVVEGIALKLLATRCRPLFVLLYRHDRSFDPPDDVIATYERVAAHHALPSINAGRSLERALRAQPALASEWFRDGVHLTDAGSDVTADLLAGAIEGISAASRVECAPAPAASPLYRPDYCETSIRAAGPSMLRHPSRHERHRLRLVCEYVQIGADNAFECRFDGRLAGVLVVKGPQSGVIRVRTPFDEREYCLWDEYCTVDRYGSVVFERPVPARTPVTMWLTDAPVDYGRSLQPLGDPAAIRRNLKVIGFLLLPA